MTKIEENKSVFGTNLDMNYLLDILKGDKNNGRKEKVFTIIGK